MYNQKWYGIKNKRIAIFFLTLVLIIVFAIPVHGADVHITKKELFPVPVEPGEDMVLEVTIANWGREKVRDLTLEIIADPAIIIKNENERLIHTDLCGYCKMAQTYHLHIDPSAVSGVYEIEIKALKDGVGISETMDVVVKGEPRLTVCDVSVHPGIICPGDNFKINFSVCNRGTGIASGVRVMSKIDDLPFIPLGTNMMIIEKLSPGGSEEIKFNLFSKDSAQPTSYLIPVKLDYKGGNGSIYSNNELVGVKLHGEAKLNIVGINTDPNRIEKGDYLTLMIRIENTGSGDAKSVKADVDIPFKGTTTAYLGKIEPDDDAPAIFNLYADEPGDYKYNLTVQYDDDLGTHEIKEEVKMTIYQGNNTSIFFVMLFILGVVSVYWFFIRK